MKSDVVLDELDLGVKRDALLDELEDELAVHAGVKELGSKKESAAQSSFAH